MSCSSATTPAASPRTLSASAMPPASVPLTASSMTVFPCASNSRIVAPCLTSMPRACMSAWLPRATSSPFTDAVTPCPPTALKSCGGLESMPISAARRNTARASGCSEPRSALAANRRMSASDNAASPKTFVTVRTPSVSVPVLSNTIVSMSSARSRYSPPLIRMPFSAPRPVPTITAVGVASPNAHGQAMTSTAIVRKRTSFDGSPKNVHAANVRRAAATTPGTK